MSLPRTFVSFSSADIGKYHLMRAWKAHDNIDFDFADFQLSDAIKSQNSYYIKSVCREKIRLVNTFVLLIGSDTRFKTDFVRDEVEVAIEKGCRLIGVNINNCRVKDSLCPAFFAGKGAMFVPFSSRIVAEALKGWSVRPLQFGESNNWGFSDAVYKELGYQLEGITATLPQPANPFHLGGRPTWAR
jgi:hypothetical protein